jgi:hypothetical protein
VVFTAIPFEECERYVAWFGGGVQKALKSRSPPFSRSPYVFRLVEAFESDSSPCCRTYHGIVVGFQNDVADISKELENSRPKTEVAGNVPASGTTTTPKA